MRGVRWLILGTLGLLGLIAGAFIHPRATLAAYLAGFGFALSLMLGALLLILIAHLTGARWMLMFRRFAELMASTCFALAVAFIPIALGIGHLYQWAFPIESLPSHVRELMEHKKVWLNQPFFLVRTVIYFVVFLVTSELFLRWSARQDPEDPSSTTRIRTLAGASIWPVVFSLTFASIDWFMSVDAAWVSTMYPVYFFAGSFLAALALMTVIGRAAEHRGGIDRSITPSHYHAIGKLTLTFVIFWAYIAFCQFMLIWTADLPTEVDWYIDRMGGFFGVLAVVLIVGHFAIPFFLLLSRPLKRRANALVGVASFLLVMHWVDVLWLIVPTTNRVGSPSVWWLHVAALFFFVGLLGLVFTWRASGRSLLVEGDPFLPSALEYHTS